MDFYKYGDLIKSIQREIWVYTIEHQGARPVKIFVNTVMFDYLCWEVRNPTMSFKNCINKTLFGIPIQEYCDNSDSPEYYFAQERGHLWKFNEYEPIEIPVMVKDKECDYLK